jgi:hypothetical protein
MVNRSLTGGSRGAASLSFALSRSAAAPGVPFAGGQRAEEQRLDLPQPFAKLVLDRHADSPL